MPLFFISIYFNIILDVSQKNEEEKKNNHLNYIWRSFINAFSSISFIYIYIYLNIFISKHAIIVIVFIIMIY